MNRRLTARFFMTIMLMTALIFPAAVSAESDAPDVEGTSVIMIDKASGEVLYSKNADEKRDPASITKILTCLLVLENLDTDKVVTVPENSSPVGVNINMKKGEKLTVEQLLYAMMLPSANDAARVLAIETSGDIESFCTMMNERAAECGAENTHFTNPNGLNVPGQEKHRTTARDLAYITGEALDNEQFREIVSTVKYKIPATDKSAERKLKTTNPLLNSGKSIEVEGVEIPLRYEKTTGVKTGTTSVAGNCFAGSARDGDTELIVVTLNSGEYTRFTDAIQLFEYGFNNFSTNIIADKGQEIQLLKVRRGETGHVSAGPSETLAVTCSINEDGSVEEPDVEAKFTAAREKVDAPVKKGDVLGEIQLVDSSGKVVKSTDAVALENVEKGGPLSAVGIPDDMVPLFAAVVVTLALIVVIVVILVRNRRKCRNKKTSCEEEAREETADTEKDV